MKICERVCNLQFYQLTLLKQELQKILYGEAVTSTRINWITKNKQRILRIDFTKLYGKNFIDQINNLSSFLDQTHETDVFALVDITDSYLNTEVFKTIEKTAKLANTKIKKVAILGSTPVQKTFITFLKTITHIQFNTFENKDKALAWLTRDDK